jgi:uncharacterized protein
MAEPLIWVLCGARAGDTAQALELARRVGGRVVEKKLTFNKLHYIPNVLRPADLSSLTDESRAVITVPWPDLVIATGKRTAPIACAIKVLSPNTKLVQLGRPRMALRRFDLLITTPQYGLPSDANVISLPTPFAAAKPVDEAARDKWAATWKDLPRPWVMMAVGASKFPLRFAEQDQMMCGLALNTAVQRLGGSVLLFDSPRSIANTLDNVAGRLTGPFWRSDHSAVGGAYQAALSLADFYGVTGDSVSMVSEMLGTSKPVAVYHLPRMRSFNWSAKRGPAALLARSGVLSPPRDVERFMAALYVDGKTGRLGESWGRPGFDDAAHDDAVARIKRLLA